jgi:DNA replication protein DnaC
VVDDFKGGDYSVLGDMFEVDLLVIDDIGAEHDPSKSGVNKLCQILSRRETKFTVITSNISPAHWPERFDTRIADRLLRNSEVIELWSVPSYAEAC